MILDINKYIQNIMDNLNQSYSNNILIFLLYIKYIKKKIDPKVIVISGIAGPDINVTGSNINK